MRRHEKKNVKINKYLIKTKDNDKVLINEAIKLAADKRNVVDKHTMTKGRKVTIDENHTDTPKNKTTIRHRSKNIGNAFSAATHRRINSITRDGKHVQFRNSPTIVT